MGHTIAITRMAGEDADEPEYSISGFCEPHCYVYRPCRKHWHRHPINEHELLDEWSTKRVPEEHLWIEGEWMVYSGECGISHANEIYELYNLPEGQYDLDVDWDGDWWIVSIVTPTPPAEESSDDHGRHHEGAQQHG